MLRQIMLLRLIQTSDKEMPRLLSMVKDGMGLLQLRRSIGTPGTSIGGAWWERIDWKNGGTLRKAHEMHCNGLKLCFFSSPIFEPKLKTTWSGGISFWTHHIFSVNSWPHENVGSAKNMTHAGPSSPGLRDEVVEILDQQHKMPWLWVQRNQSRYNINTATAT